MKRDLRVPLRCASLQLSGSRLSAGGHRGAEIPVPIPNTEVKRPIAEGSAGPARARVGRRRLFYFLERFGDSVGLHGGQPFAGLFLFRLIAEFCAT